MDNRIFDVNGSSKETLKLALDCLLNEMYSKVRGWYYSPEKGLILTWTNNTETHKKAKPFTDQFGEPFEEVTIDELVEILYKWLDSDDAKKVPYGDWEGNLHDSDVSNSIGWRLYTESWGHITNNDGHTMDHYSMAAFKRINCWYGK
jgi:hypothetical protein